VNDIDALHLMQAPKSYYFRAGPHHKNFQKFHLRLWKFAVFCDCELTSAELPESYHRHT